MLVLEEGNQVGNYLSPELECMHSIAPFLIILVINSLGYELRMIYNHNKSIVHWWSNRRSMKVEHCLLCFSGFPVK